MTHYVLLVDATTDPEKYHWALFNLTVNQKGANSSNPTHGWSIKKMTSYPMFRKSMRAHARKYNAKIIWGPKPETI